MLVDVEEWREDFLPFKGVFSLLTKVVFLRPGGRRRCKWTQE